jgi:hypothetical protein
MIRHLGPEQDAPTNVERIKYAHVSTVQTKVPDPKYTTSIITFFK